MLASHSIVARKLLLASLALLLVLAAWAPMARPVQAAPAPTPQIGSVTVGAQNGTLNAGTAGSVTYQVTINRGTGRGSGGTFDADMSVTGLAAGVTATWSQDPVTINNAANSAVVTLTLTTTAATPGGADTFTVRAQTGWGGGDNATANVTMTVRYATTTAITSDTPDPSVTGQAVAVRYTVTGTGGPAGNVTVTDGVDSCTGTVAAGTCNLTLTTPGARPLTAAFAGSATHVGSTSAAAAHTVNKANTTTALTAAPNPSSEGQSVTLTATVAAAAPGAGTPAGTVTFYADGTAISGAVNLAGGTATFSTTTLAGGSRALTAVYAGNAAYNGSTSPAVTQVVKRAATTALTSSLNPSRPGQSVTFTARVTGAAGTPTGSVVFRDGATTLGTVNLTNGVATYTTTTLAAGNRTITAAYGGDAAYGASTGTLTQVVDGVNPSAAMDSGPTNPTNDNTPTFTFSGTDNLTPAASLTFECSLDSTTTYTPCASPLTLPAVTDGSHTFRARAIDQAGNRSPDALYTWVTDTVVPDTSINTRPANPTNALTATFTYTGTDGGSGVGSYQCAIDAGAFAACAAGGVTYNNLVQGSHTFQVRAVDRAGNTDPTPASFTWVIDATAPAVLSSLRVNPSPTNAASVQFTVTFSKSVTGVDAADFNLTAAGLTGAAVTTVTGSGATYTVTVNTGTGSGTLRLNVGDNDTIVDAVGNRLGGTGAGNGAYNAGEVYTIDRTAPETSFTATPANPSGAAAGFTFTGADTVTATANLKFECALDGAAFAACASPANLTGLASGSHTFQARAADEAGNVDASPAAFTWTVDADVPQVTSIARVGANPTNAASVSFTVTFSEAVTGVDAADFALTTTGLSGATITGLTPVSATVYTVSADTGTGSGDLRLDVVASPTVLDATSNPLAGPYTDGETFTVDKDAPVVTITRAGANPSNAASVDFTVTFSEPVSGVNAADFALTTTGVSGATISAVTGSGAAYTVSVSTGSGDGDIRLDVVAAPSIQDAATNPLSGPYTTGESYTIDKTTPTVTITRAGVSPTNAASVDFTVTFSKEVTGVDAADFTLTASGLTGVSISAVTPVSATVYTVSANTGSGSGTLRLDLTVEPTIQDAVGNAVAGAYTGGEVYTIDRGAPTIAIKRASPNPTSAASVDFTVTFNKDVTGVDTADFTLSASGVSGAAITSLTPVSASVYTVQVSTGTGSGTLRLDLAASATLKDLAGNPLSGPFTGGESYTVDKVSPYVIADGVIGSPDAKVMRDGSTYFTFFSSFTITFNKALNNPAGSSDPHDVTNPANYLLVGAGANRTIDTVSCQAVAQSGKPGGDDVQVTIGAVSYDAASFTARFSVNGGRALGEGKYRLFICGTTSITDTAGNKLNAGQSDTGISFSLEEAPSELPQTGFAPNQVTALPAQPADKAYADLGGLWLEIPRLGVQAPIVGVPAKDGWDVSWLNGSIGWLNGTSYPAVAGNSLLTGHVYDANGRPSVFANLNKLAYGDKIVVHNQNQTYTFEVREVAQVSPEAVSGLLKSDEHAWVNLITCRGYDEKSNAYQYRVVVRAVLVSVK